MSKRKIRQFVEEYGDGIHGTPQYDVEGSYYFINGNNLSSGKVLITEKTSKISQDEYERIKRPLTENTLLISINGTLGKIAFYNGERIALGKSACFLNIKENVNKYFVKYAMSTAEFQKYIQLVAHGSTIKNLAPSQVVDYEFEAPDEFVQDKLANVLKTLDDKIENNNIINAELEKMAKDIYDYWFLQFDFPNEEGKPYKSSGGKMVWNEELKRQIPAGWKTTTLGEITICHDSKRIPLSSKERESKKGDIPYYGATGIMDYVDEAIFEGEYILMAEDGSVMDEKGNPILQRISGKAWVNNHAHVLQPSKQHCCKLIMMLLKDVSVMKIKTGSIQMKINQENMRKIVLLDIPEDIVMNVNQLLEPIDNKIQHYQKENTELEALRDFLLPLLMSGQVVFAAKN